MSPQEGRQSIICSRSQLPVSSPMVWVNVPIIGMDFFKKSIAKDGFYDKWLSLENLAYLVK